MDTKRICPRCKGEKISPLGQKVFECDECGYLFKEFDDREDVMLKITEYTETGDVSDSRLCECMSEGVPKTGRLKTFGAAKLHMTVDSVTSDEVKISFHYINILQNRTVTVSRGNTYEFSEKGYCYSIHICGEE